MYKEMQEALYCKSLLRFPIFLVLCLYFILSILFLKESYEALSCSKHVLIFLAFEALCPYMACSFKKRVHCLPAKHASRCFRTDSRNIIGRNPSMVILLLANQDLTPMLQIYG